MKVSRGVCYCLCLAMSMSFHAFSQTINISPVSLYFGKIPEGKQAIRDLLIYNIGSQTLNITNLRIEGTDASRFKIVSNPGTISLGIAQKALLAIEFIPVTEGAFSAKIRIESNASTSPNFADLTGEGTDLGDGFIAFERIFGGPNSDGASAVKITADGGFLIAGSTTRLNEVYGDASLTKLDAFGQIEWSQWYGKEEWSEGFAETIPTDDGGYIAVGSHSHTEQRGEPNIYAVKTDASGNLIWEKSYGKSEFKPDGASDIIPAGDGGYLIAGYNQAQQDKDAYLIKIAANGDLIWEKTYGGSGGDEISRIHPSGDGGYYFVGSTSSLYTGAAGDFDFYLVKIDASGNLIWEKHYGGTDWDRAASFIITSDGGFLIAGYSASPEFGAVARDVYVVKLDATANIQWQKVYGWEHKDGAADLVATSDGGYLIVGGSEQLYDSAFETWRSDLYVIKIDGTGNEQWSQMYGGNHEDGASSVCQLSDGGYIISGSTRSYSKDSDIYLLKLDKSGDFIDIFQAPEMAPGKYHLSQNYPNPFNNSTNIYYELPQKSNVQITIYNIHGQLVRTLVHESQQAGRHVVKFKTGDLTSGLYFYQIKADDFCETRRMLFLK